MERRGALPYEAFLPVFKGATGEVPFRPDTRSAPGGFPTQATTSRTFVLKIGFELEGNATLGLIAAELADAGLSRDNWSLVHEGEIVSPVLYDDARTWRGVERVLEILSEHGATVNDRTTATVQVGTRDFGNRYDDLARIADTHQDVLARLGSTPVRGETPDGTSAIGTEFVQFRAGGSLDAGVLRQRVVLGTGIVDAVARGAEVAPGRPRPIGHHLAEHGEDGESFRASASFRSLLGAVVDGLPVPRAIPLLDSATKLYVATRWQPAEPASSDRAAEEPRKPPGEPAVDLGLDGDSPDAARAPHGRRFRRVFDPNEYYTGGGAQTSGAPPPPRSMRGLVADAGTGKTGAVAAELEAALTQAGAELAKLHGSHPDSSYGSAPAELATSEPVRDAFTVLRAAMDLLALPGVPELAGKVRRGLVWEPVWFGQVHGAATLEAFTVDGDRTTLSPSAAESAATPTSVDVRTFLGDLESHAKEAGLPERQRALLRETFLAAYERAGGVVPVEPGTTLDTGEQGQLSRDAAELRKLLRRRGSRAPDEAHHQLVSDAARKLLTASAAKRENLTAGLAESLFGFVDEQVRRGPDARAFLPGVIADIRSMLTPLDLGEIADFMTARLQEQLTVDSATVPFPAGVASVTSAGVDQQLTEAFAGYIANGDPDTFTGADGTYGLTLPDGSYLMSFSDTYLGTVNEDGSRDPVVQEGGPTPFLHNSFVRIRPDGTLETVAGPMPHPEGGKWYWSGDAHRTEDGTIEVTYQEWDSPTGQIWDWRKGPNVVARYTGGDLSAPARVYPLPSATGVAWTAAILKGEDGYRYVYGVEDLGDTKYLRVARVAGDSLAGQWEFYTEGGSWSIFESDAARVMPGVANEFSVTRVGDSYVLITHDTRTPVSPDIVGYVAPTPFGPFTGPTHLYTTPETGEDGTYGNENVFTYNAHAHPEIDRGPGRLVVSYNVNSFDNTDTYRDASIYVPRFIVLTFDQESGTIRASEDSGFQEALRSLKGVDIGRLAVEGADLYALYQRFGDEFERAVKLVAARGLEYVLGLPANVSADKLQGALDRVAKSKKPRVNQVPAGLVGAAVLFGYDHADSASVQAFVDLLTRAGISPSGRDVEALRAVATDLYLNGYYTATQRRVFDDAEWLRLAVEARDPAAHPVNMLPALPPLPAGPEESPSLLDAGDRMALLTGQPRDLPLVAELTEHLNERFDGELDPQETERRLRKRFARLAGEDGDVWQVGASEVRIRVRLSDPEFAESAATAEIAFEVSERDTVGESFGETTVITETGARATVVPTRDRTFSGTQVTGDAPGRPDFPPVTVREMTERHRIARHLVRAIEEGIPVDAHMREQLHQYLDEFENNNAFADAAAGGDGHLFVLHGEKVSAVVRHVITTRDDNASLVASADGKVIHQWGDPGDPRGNPGVVHKLTAYTSTGAELGTTRVMGTMLTETAAEDAHAYGLAILEGDVPPQLRTEGTDEDRARQALRRLTKNGQHEPSGGFLRELTMRRGARSQGNAIAPVREMVMQLAQEFGLVPDANFVPNGVSPAGDEAMSYWKRFAQSLGIDTSANPSARRHRIDNMIELNHLVRRENLLAEYRAFTRNGLRKTVDVPGRRRFLTDPDSVRVNLRLRQNVDDAEFLGMTGPADGTGFGVFRVPVTVVAELEAGGVVKAERRRFGSALVYAPVPALGGHTAEVVAAQTPVGVERTEPVELAPSAGLSTKARSLPASEHPVLEPVSLPTLPPRPGSVVRGVADAVLGFFERSRAGYRPTGSPLSWRIRWRDNDVAVDIVVDPSAAEARILPPEFSVHTRQKDGEPETVAVPATPVRVVLPAYPDVPAGLSHLVGATLETATDALPSTLDGWADEVVADHRDAPAPPESSNETPATPLQVESAREVAFPKRWKATEEALREVTALSERLLVNATVSSAAELAMRTHELVTTLNALADGHDAPRGDTRHAARRHFAAGLRLLATDLSEASRTLEIMATVGRRVDGGRRDLDAVKLLVFLDADVERSAGRAHRMLSAVEERGERLLELEEPGRLVTVEEGERTTLFNRHPKPPLRFRPSEADVAHVDTVLSLLADVETDLAKLNELGHRGTVAENFPTAVLNQHAPDLVHNQERLRKLLYVMGLNETTYGNERRHKFFRKIQSHDDLAGRLTDDGAALVKLLTTLEQHPVPGLGRMEWLLKYKFSRRMVFGKDFHFADAIDEGFTGDPIRSVAIIPTSELSIYARDYELADMELPERPEDYDTYAVVWWSGDPAGPAGGRIPYRRHGFTIQLEQADHVGASGSQGDPWVEGSRMVVVPGTGNTSMAEADAALTAMLREEIRKYALSQLPPRHQSRFTRSMVMGNVSGHMAGYAVGLATWGVDLRLLLATLAQNLYTSIVNPIVLHNKEDRDPGAAAAIRMTASWRGGLAGPGLSRLRGAAHEITAKWGKLADRYGVSLPTPPELPSPLATPGDRETLSARVRQMAPKLAAALGAEEEIVRSLPEDLLKQGSFGEMVRGLSDVRWEGDSSTILLTLGTGEQVSVEFVAGKGPFSTQRIVGGDASENRIDLRVVYAPSESLAKADDDVLWHTLSGELLSGLFKAAQVWKMETRRKSLSTKLIPMGIQTAVIFSFGAALNTLNLAAQTIGANLVGQISMVLARYKNSRGTKLISAIWDDKRRERLGDERLDGPVVLHRHAEHAVGMLAAGAEILKRMRSEVESSIFVANMALSSESLFDDPSVLLDAAAEDLVAHAKARRDVVNAAIEYDTETSERNVVIRTRTPKRGKNSRLIRPVTITIRLSHDPAIPDDFSPSTVHKKYSVPERLLFMAIPRYSTPGERAEQLGAELDQVIDREGRLQPIGMGALFTQAGVVAASDGGANAVFSALGPGRDPSVSQQQRDIARLSAVRDITGVGEAAVEGVFQVGAIRQGSQKRLTGQLEPVDTATPTGRAMDNYLRVAIAEAKKIMAATAALHERHSDLVSDEVRAWHRDMAARFNGSLSVDLEGFRQLVYSGELVDSIPHLAGIELIGDREARLTVDKLKKPGPGGVAAKTVGKHPHQVVLRFIPAVPGHSTRLLPNSGDSLAIVSVSSQDAASGYGELLAQLALLVSAYHKAPTGVPGLGALALQELGMGAAPSMVRRTAMDVLKEGPLRMSGLAAPTGIAAGSAYVGVATQAWYTRRQFLVDETLRMLMTWDGSPASPLRDQIAYETLKQLHRVVSEVYSDYVTLADKAGLSRDPDTTPWSFRGRTGEKPALSAPVPPIPPVDPPVIGARRPVPRKRID
ncbi:hypothetical protein BAY61_18710 [Prauserella marina]|nr:hypothetical protein BAY61_18710 [Prauserella marina]